MIKISPKASSTIFEKLIFSPQYLFAISHIDYTTKKFNATQEMPLCNNEFINYNIFLKYFPVYDFSSLHNSSGVPHLIIYPPLSPPSGPKSIK